MGCNCGGSVWNPAAAVDPQDTVTSGPVGINNPATFWTGPPDPPAPEPDEQPVEQPANA